jgi:hypothetical protein
MAAPRLERDDPQAGAAFAKKCYNGAKHHAINSH